MMVIMDAGAVVAPYSIRMLAAPPLFCAHNRSFSFFCWMWAASSCRSTFAAPAFSAATLAAALNLESLSCCLQTAGHGGGCLAI